MRLMSFLLGSTLALCVLGSLFYGMRHQQSVMTFDKDVIQGQFIRQLAEVGANESQVELSTRRFNAVLHRVLAGLAQQKKVIILRKSDVFAGGVDITDEVILKCHEAMRVKS
ncbi:TrbI F-type domain-containing protein (plasmid) [Legionella sp. D16C41]|uniref:TrbI F-type domain-containing protein n=1 Tax=Legionella sp. D16C41 TaxID=3402688 RepID=UPI003AF839DB